MKINRSGFAEEFAGGGMDPPYSDGLGVNAGFQNLGAMATDMDENIYIAEFDTARVRKISPNGLVSTLAGSRSQPLESLDGTGIDARFSTLDGIAVDGEGNVFVTDANTIRRISKNGKVKTLAGTPNRVASGIPTGAKTASLRVGELPFSGLSGIAVDMADNIYVADIGNNIIWKGSLTPQRKTQLPSTKQ